MKPAIVAFLIGLFMLCPRAVRADPVTLAGGKTVEVISAGPGESDHVLAIKYRTTVPLDDMTALHEEADAVWDHFAPDEKQAKYDQAILSAATADGTADFALKQ